MLQKIRDGSSGPLAYIVVAVIAFVFGVWGIGSYFTPSSDPVVVSAAGTDITQSQFREAFNQRYQKLRQMMGDHFDASQFPRDRIRQNVLDSMIDQAVMTHYAKNAGYRVTDADLLAQIRNNPQFQKNGQFSSERYKALLSRAGVEPSQYEARLRQGMLDGQVRQLIAASAFAAPPEVDATYQQAYEQRKIAVLSFDPSAYAEQVSVDDAAIKKYYDQHSKQFMRPPRVKLAYVSLGADNLSPETPDKDTLKKLYQSHRKELGTPEKRSAGEVRIAIQDGDDAQARKTVQKALKSAKEGQSLKKIAAQTKGAEFQHIDNKPKSDLPKAVGEALFGLNSGALSSPVRSGDAWYLLRLTDSTLASTPDFDDPSVQKHLKAMARQQAIAKLFRSKSQKLEDLAYQAPNGLDLISKKLGLKIQHTGWIEKNGEDSGLGAHKAVRKAAFSDDVLKDKLNSKVLDLGDQRRVVLRVSAHQEAKRKPLSQVKNAIHKQLVAHKAQESARKAAQQAMSHAQGGKSLSDIASSTPGTTFDKHGFVGRSNNQLDSQVLGAAFDMPAKGDSDHPQYRIVTTGKDQVALVAVTGSRVEKDNSGQSGPSRQQIAQRLKSYNARLEYGAFDHYLRQQTDIKIHKKALQ